MFRGDHCSDRSESCLWSFESHEAALGEGLNFFGKFLGLPMQFHSVHAPGLKTKVANILQKLLMSDCLASYSVINIPAFHFYRTCTFYRAGDVFNVILAIFHLTVTILPDTGDQTKNIIWKSTSCCTLNWSCVYWKEEACSSYHQWDMFHTDHIKLAAELKMFKSAL